MNEAYTVLSDPKKKQQYDMGAYDPTGAGGHEHGGTHFHGFNGGGIDISELFNGMGGAGNSFFSMFTQGGMGGMGGPGGRRGGRGQGGQQHHFGF